MLSVYTGKKITYAMLQPESYLVLAQGETDVSDLYQFSPLLVQDLRKVVASDRYQGHKGHSVSSVTARFRAVLTACRYVISNIVEASSLQIGLAGFKENDFCLLKLTYRSDIRNQLFNELLIAMQVLQGEPILCHQYPRKIFCHFISKA